ncbi:hypothetical protein [Hyphococcus sp.]|uniref:hypothetical protein n=1 Tax=Hyphococcus sp. TaxID=2038636 RepID=UPI003CCBD276
MNRVWRCIRLSLVGIACGAVAPLMAEELDAPAPAAPHYEVDTSWPKLPLPNNWAIGELGGIFVDERDHVWIVHRPGTLFPWERGAAMTPPRSSCCFPAPPVIEFNPEGEVVGAWGGPGDGYDWPTVEHGITVDHNGDVWIGGSSTREGRNGEPPDGMVLKFSADGEFLMQIGGSGPSKGSLDVSQLSGASDMVIDPETNEVFIADGYGNNRVIVFDASTGAFKRQWGAYGKPPTDEELPAYNPDAEPANQFRTAHCITLSKDDFIYVCDRDNNRIQIFTTQGEFRDEYRYGLKTLPPGTVGHVSLSPDENERILAVTDLGNFQVRLVRRSDGEQLSVFGHFGHYAGQLNRVHQAVFNSHGDIFTAEAAGKRIQRWKKSSSKPDGASVE